MSGGIVDIRTGKPLTRRDFGRGIAAILASGVAPSIMLGAVAAAGSANASVGRGMMRNVGARNAAMFGGEKPTAKDYVQDGLIAMWDGIENAGWGLHDNNSQWVDLVDLSATTGGDGIVWHSDHAESSSGSSYFSASSSTQNRLSWTNFTIEIGCDGMANLTSGYAYSANLRFDNYGYIGWGIINVTWPRSGVSPTTLGIKAYTFSVGDTENHYGFGNLIKSLTKLSSYNARKSFTFMNNVMKLYWVRIYARELSAKEISTNYAIDKARFNLP